MEEIVQEDPYSFYQFSQITSALTERLFGWYRRYFQDKSHNFGEDTLEQTTSCKLALRGTFVKRSRRTPTQTYSEHYTPVQMKLRKLEECTDGLNAKIGVHAKNIILNAQKLANKNTQTNKQTNVRPTRKRSNLKRL